MLCRELSTMPEPTDVDASRPEVPDDAMGVLPGGEAASVVDPSGSAAFHFREGSGGVHCPGDAVEASPVLDDGGCCRPTGASCCPVVDAVVSKGDDCPAVPNARGVCREYCVRCRV